MDGRLTPVSRRELVKRLRKIGFDGPFSGGKHQAMRHPDGRRIILPNPHQSDVGSSLLKRILRQAGISEAQWHEVGGG